MRAPAAAYSTQQEYNFIDSLGTNSIAALEGRITRRELLSKYLTAIRQRNRWDFSDKYLVINYLKESMK